MLRIAKGIIAIIAVVLLALQVLSFNASLNDYSRRVTSLQAPDAPVTVQQGSSSNRYLTATPPQLDVTDTAWFELIKARDDFTSKAKQAEVNILAIVGGTLIAIYALRDTYLLS